MSKACSNCGVQNADEAKFCRSCGKAFELASPPAPLADDSTIIGTPCRVCGHINRPGIRFCAQCGADQAMPARAPVDPPPYAPPAPYPDTEPPMDSEATVFMQPLSDATVIMPRVHPPAPDPYYPEPLAPLQPDAPEPYQIPAPEPYVPMPTGPGSLPPAPHDPSAATAKSMALWIGLAVVLLIAIAAAIWWFMQSRPTVVNTFDSAPPPSVLAASSPAAAPAEDLRPASAPEMPPASPADAASAAMPEASAPTAPAPDSFDNGASGPAIGTNLAPVSSGGSTAGAPTAAAPVDADAAKQAAAKEAAAKDKAAREAKAKALREQRLAAASQAAADAARKHVDESRPRSAPVVASSATPPPVPALAAPAAAQPRTVAEVCTSGNSLVRGICEARECVGSEHANEDICRRIRAADDRRRQ